MKDEIVDQVVNKYYMRSVVGIKKYSTTLEGNNTDDFLEHALEEAMDFTLYIQKLMDQNREITELVKSIPNNEELGANIRRLVS